MPTHHLLSSDKSSKVAVGLDFSSDLGASTFDVKRDCCQDGLLASPLEHFKLHNFDFCCFREEVYYFM